MKNKDMLPMSLRAAYLALHRETNVYAVKCGMTADQFVCLLLLFDEDGITQQELARRATSDPNTIRAMLLLLEKQGLIVREHHPTDGRAWWVKITPKGRQMVKNLSTMTRPVRDRLVAPFNTEEIENLISCLHRISQAMAENV